MTHNEASGRDAQTPALRGVFVLGLLVGGLGSSCRKETPPAPQGTPAAAKAGASAQAQFFVPDKHPAVLTYAADKGKFLDTQSVQEIPKEAQGLVRVRFLEQARQPGPGLVWVANLQAKGPEGYELKTIARKNFELAALGAGRRSQVKLPEGLELPKVVQNDGIVIYKTVWCGVCNKVQQYLQQKGVKFVAKDIEKDPKAAAELKAKAKKAGVATGSVPIIDVHGTLMVGFDRGRLDKLIAQAQS